MKAVAFAQQVCEDEARRQVQEWVEGEMPANTRAAYESAMNGWNTWCAQRSIKADEFEPVWMSLYLRGLSEQEKAKSTISTFISAVRKHRQWNEDEKDPTQDRLVVAAYDVAMKKAPQPNPKLPLTWEMVCAMAANVLDKKGGIAAVRDMAMVVLMHTALLRASEVVSLNDADVWMYEYDSPSSGKTIRRRMIKLLIKRQKNDQEGKGEIRQVSTRWGIQGESVEAAMRQACPALWLAFYLACRAAGKRVDPPVDWNGMKVEQHSSGMEQLMLARQEGAMRYADGGSASPLFTSCTGKGGRLSAQTPNGRVKGMVNGIGLNGDLYGSHSARAGGATEAMRGGSDLLAVKEHGGWRSNAVEGYIRRGDDEKSAVTNYVRRS
jgi:site-specific recombinase XerD